MGGCLKALEGDVGVTCEGEGKVREEKRRGKGSGVDREDESKRGVWTKEGEVEG